MSNGETEMTNLITYTKISSPQGDHEASISLKWYAAIGAYEIKVFGLGTSKDEAAKSAMLMLGQAKAALSVATTEQVVASLQGDAA